MADTGKTGGQPAPIEQHDDETPQPQLRADFYLDRQAGSIEPLEHHREAAHHVR